MSAGADREFDPQAALAKLAAEFDQAEASTTSFAKLICAYYWELISQRVPESTSVVLTTGYQFCILGSAPAMPPPPEAEQ